MSDSDRGERWLSSLAAGYPATQLPIGKKRSKGSKKGEKIRGKRKKGGKRMVGS